MAGQGAQPLLFREGVGKALNDFFTRFAPGQPPALPLTMRLTELVLAETQGFTPTVMARMQAEFYWQQPDSSYLLVASFARTSQQSVVGGPNATLLSHAANLGALWLSAATVGADRTAWLTAGPRYPAAHVAAATASTVAPLAILAPNAPLQPGFYYSLTDFTSNQPSETGQPEVESRPYLGTEWAGDVELKPYHQVNGQRVLATNVWGFCDGTHAYIRQGPDFYQLRQREGTFVFFGRTGAGPLLHSAANLLSLASLANGAGAIVTTTAEHRALYQLDIATGEVRLSPSAWAAPSTLHTRPTQVFVYRPRSAKGPAVRIQLADGQPAQELAAGSYLDFSPPANQPIRLSLLPAQGPAVELPLVPTSEAALYLECLPAAAEPLRQVKNATGAAALNRLVQ